MRTFRQKSDFAKPALAMAVALALVGCGSESSELEGDDTDLQSTESAPPAADGPFMSPDTPTNDVDEPADDPADVPADGPADVPADVPADAPTGDTGLAVGSLDTSYEFLRLAGDSECLNVNETGNYQLVGSYIDGESRVVSENLSGFATIDSAADSRVSVISVGDSGISLQVNETTIAAVALSAGDQTITHYVSAIPETTSRPIIVARQTEDWCAYVIYGSDGSCASVTSSTISDGQTTTILAAATATVIGPDGDEIAISAQGCELDNPQGIPVLQVGN